ncbi:MAG: hypothetical protein DMD83_01960, partial [Candidatus Rokuibacteriota bacterium]
MHGQNHGGCDRRLRLSPGASPAGPYAYVTLHRKELTDRSDVLVDVFRALAELARDLDAVVFPMHPRTRDVMARHRIPPSERGDVVVTEPVS